MFEQSILLPEPGNKRWTFAASIVAEVAAVSLLLLVPLIYTERLGLGWIQSSVMRPPSPPLAPLPPRVAIRNEVQPASRRVFVPMPLYPSAHPRPLDEVLRSMDDAPPQVCPNCVEGSVSSDRMAGIPGIGTTAVLPPPPPKPPVKPAEVKKPAEPTAPVRVSLGAQEAKIIRRIIPAYPALAKQVRVQGSVRLLGVISRDGTIEQLQVISGHPLLVKAAVDAVKQWLYRPTLLNGQPIEVSAPIEVNFILSN